jgi:hypothetical protein
MALEVEDVAGRDRDDGGGTPDVQACVRLCSTRSIAAAAVESGGAVVLAPVVQYEY